MLYALGQDSFGEWSSSWGSTFHVASLGRRERLLSRGSSAPCSRMDGGGTAVSIAVSSQTMPAPPKTTDAEIIRAARKLIEAKGYAGFSMADVAAAVGVRAPSLYGRFADRSALLSAVELEVLYEIARVVGSASRSRDPVLTLTAQARAYRRFARANPGTYTLIYSPDAARTEAGTLARSAALAPTLPALSALVGEANALLAARALVPFMHGFVSMEIAGAFRLGPELDVAFENGVATILAGLVKRGAKSFRPRR
jgi:AcrR family transcriptional regulator